MPLPKDPSKIQEWKRKVGFRTKLGKKYSLQIVKSTDNLEPTETQPKVTKGIYLVPPHGELIWKGKKSIIVKTRKFHIQEPLFLVSGKKAYGIIQLGFPEPITKKEFDSLKDKHKITQKEFEKWGWKGKQLYAYRVSLITKFYKPKPVRIKRGTQTFIKKVEFLSLIRKDVIPRDLSTRELLLLHARLHALYKHLPHNWSKEDVVNLHALVVKEMRRRGIKHVSYDELDEVSKKFLLEELIKDPEHYDPSKLSDKVLLDDHRIVHAWWTSLLRGKKLYHENGKLITKEEVRHLHDLIVKELEKRGFVHKTPLPEHLAQMPSRVKEITDKLKPAVLIENFATLVGSYITNKENPNDIDILFRFDRTSPEFVERAAKVRIAKMLDDIDKEIHFTNDPEGPHDSYVPLFDLALIPKTPKLVELAAKTVQLFKPYLPMKPYGSAYYNIEDVVNQLKENKEYSFEFKYNGFHVVVHKKGDKVKIFSEQLKDISLPFPSLREYIKKLSANDFIVDGELVPYSESGKALGRDPLMKFIGAVKSGKKLDDSNIKMHVFDITYFNKPIINLPLRERQKILSKLNYNKRVERVLFKIGTKKDARKIINWATNQPGSEGCVIKDLDSPYVFDEKSKGWIKFRHLVDIHAIVIKKVPKKKNLFNYLVGIIVSQKEINKLHPKYVIDFRGKKVLVLGHTFNTPKEVPEGSIIDVALEDVWRHTYPKIHKVRYSIHKPRFRQRRPDLKTTSSIQDLEDIVTSIGEEVVEE